MLCTKIGVPEVSVGLHREDIRRMLLQHRRELLDEIQNNVRDVRELGFTNDHQHADLRDTVDAQHGDDLVFALIQMRAETLVRVDDAVRRCDEGTYGYCDDCGEVIAPVRLRALPFAVRCRDCEEKYEGNQRQERARVQQACQIPWRSRDVSSA